MSQQHKSLLIRNRLRLVRELHPSQEFFAVMQSNYTLTATMIEEIESVKTVQGKVGKFLDILPRRGSEAFPTFIEALKETHQDQLAVLLDPTNTSSLPSGGFISQPKDSGSGVGQLTPSTVSSVIDQPKSKLEDASSRKQLYQPSDSSPGNPPSSKGPVQQHQSSYEDVTSRPKSENISADMNELTECVYRTKGQSFIYNIYPVDDSEEPGKTPRLPELLRNGRCLVFRNKKNHGYEANFDDVNLTETFKKFGIKVQSTIENKSREDILDRLSKAIEIDKTSSSFFLFVFAPGSGDLIVTDSGDFVSTFDIVNVVKNSEALKGKPKVLIFHLVDPGSLDHMDSVAESAYGAPPSLELSGLNLNATEDNLAILKVVPNSSDDLQIHWLVSSLIFLMTKYSKYYDLTEILDRVKLILKPQGYSVTLSSSLTSGLYFTSFTRE